MASTVIDIADGVVAIVNAASVANKFRSAITAERKFVAQMTREALASTAAPKAAVLPSKIVRESVSLALHKKHVVVDVVVHQMAADSAVPGLMELTEQIGDFFFRKRFESIKADCLKAEDLAIYDAPSLATEGVFVAAVRLTFARNPA